MKTRKVDVKLTDPDGKILFEKKQFEVPYVWSDRAATIMASKYAMNSENSAIQIIGRVVAQIAKWGWSQGYFDEEYEQLEFADKLEDILRNQRAAFNSPVWINVGSNTKTSQASACFVLPVEDDMNDILEHCKREGFIFAGGSGAGINISKLRAEGEMLSNGGTSSGPLSFNKGWDRMAGAIKSGGRIRRAARLVCMDVDHPDIIKFIECKTKEERKAKILIDGGIDEKEAYETVAYQNANHSVRVTDDFMQTVEADGSWFCPPRKAFEGGSYPHKAKDILRKMAECAWEVGDPGIQFHDRMNIDNPVPTMGEIRGTNPCQPKFATVLTPEGIKTFDDINVGSVIWSGEKFTKVTQKIATGEKPVFRYQTTAGVFLGTENHRILQNGEKIEIKDANSIDRSESYDEYKSYAIDPQSVVDGWVFGDGSVHKASDNLVYLTLGVDDEQVFIENFKDYIIKSRPGLSRGAWEVITSIVDKELPKTYDRAVPKRFKHGNREVVIGFLRGLYTANGSICGNRITLKATSFQVISDVQEMLSSLNIASYFTTNKSKEVQFKNGIFQCKQSYDLNITVDRQRFSGMIGFVHPHKKTRLKNLLNRINKSCKPPKKSYEIIEKEWLGNWPVWDITVEAAEHTYWTGGLLVSNCSEFSAVDNSSCNLASLNLVKYFTDDRKEGDHLNWELFEKDIEILITAMDILVEAADYPTEEIREITVATRPLGLGFSNLGALLMLMGLPYDSKEARDLAADITKHMTTAAYYSSIDLAKKLGSFPAFEENKQRCIDIASMRVPNTFVNDAIKKHGLRNSQLTLLAPTGTISFIMDCDTTGIEPLIFLSMTKQMSDGSTMKIVPKCVKGALSNLETKTIGNLDPNTTQSEVEISLLSNEEKEIFRTANEISWKGHIDMMAACQQHLNGAISKSVNLPADCTVEDIEEAYMYAWKKGIKAVAVYRNGSKGMQPLIKSKEPNAKTIAAMKELEENRTTGVTLDEFMQEIDKVDIEFSADDEMEWKAVRKKLPDTCYGPRHKFSIAGFEGYVRASTYEDGRVGEIWINASKCGSMVQGLLDAFATAISLALQYGVPLEHLVEKFTNSRFDPQGITQNEDIRICRSIIDYIFQWMALEFLEEDEYNETVLENEEPLPEFEKITLDGSVCHNCGGTTQKSGTCDVCLDCGSTSGCG